jgi:hypothetical protein
MLGARRAWSLGLGASGAGLIAFEDLVIGD